MNIKQIINEEVNKFIIKEGDPIEYMLRNYTLPNQRNNMPVAESTNDVSAKYKLPNKKFKNLYAFPQTAKPGSLLDIYEDGETKKPIVRNVQLKDVEDVMKLLTTENSYTLYQRLGGRATKKIVTIAPDKIGHYVSKLKR